jgi:hypothetical protein
MLCLENKIILTFLSSDLAIFEAVDIYLLKENLLRRRMLGCVQ